jgi:hypothetical protein
MTHDTPPDSAQRSLREQWHTLAALTPRRTIAAPRRFRGRMRRSSMRDALRGAAVVEAVTADLRRAARDDELRVLPRRVEAGRMWELLVRRQAMAPHQRVIAALARSTRPPWRLDRVTYVVVAEPDARPHRRSAQEGRQPRE